MKNYRVFVPENSRIHTSCSLLSSALWPWPALLWTLVMEKPTRKILLQILQLSVPLLLYDLLFMIFPGKVKIRLSQG